MLTDILAGIIAFPITLALLGPFAAYYDKVRERGPSQGWEVNE